MTHTSTEQPEALMRLADNYARACFDQGLYQRTTDDKPEAEREKLEKAIRRLHARVQELEAENARLIETYVPNPSATEHRKNVREGAAYESPAFEALARDLGVWGTAQSTVCAQFWQAAQAQRAPLMSDSRKVISDEELQSAFSGTNFGTTDYRGLLHVAMLKKACSYHCGHTITQIMKELRLIGATGAPIKRGIKFLRASYHQQMLDGA